MFRRSGSFGLFAILFVVASLAVAVPLSAQEDQEGRNRAAFLRIIEEAFNQGEMSVLSEVFAPDFLNHSPNGDANREASIGTIAAFRAAMPDLTMTPVVVLAEGDLVAGHFLFEGTFVNPFQTPNGAIPPTGAPVRYSIQTIHRFNEDGQSVEEWIMWDNMSLFMQLGVMLGASEEVGVTDDAETVIRRFYQLNNAEDTEGQNALWADDATLTLPDGTVLEGREEVTSFSPGHTQITISEVEVDGNTVRWTSTTETGDVFLLEAVVEDGQIQAMSFR